MSDKEIKQMVFNKTPIDRIIEIIKMRDCVEVIGTAGGDTLTYRFYKDGTTVER